MIKHVDFFFQYPTKALWVFIIISYIEKMYLLAFTKSDQTRCCSDEETLSKWLLKIAQLASVAQLDVRPTGDEEVVGLTPPGQEHSFLEI